MSARRASHQRSPLDEALEQIDERGLDDMVEQTYAVLESRGAPRCTLKRDWILRWLKEKKSPMDIVNIALGDLRWKTAPKADAHLGGRRA